MKLDSNYSISVEKATEMAKKPKKEVYKWLWDLPIYQGIYIKIREDKLKKLTDEIKQLKPKTSKSKPAANTGADTKDNSDGFSDKEGEN